MSWQPQSQWGMDQWGPFTPQGMNFGNNPSFGSTSTGSSGLGGLGGAGGAGNGFQVGWNMPTFQLGLQGLNTIGMLAVLGYAAGISILFLAMPFLLEYVCPKEPQKGHGED